MELLLQKELLIWNRYILACQRKINDSVFADDVKAVVFYLDEITMTKKIICNIIKESRIRQGRLRMKALLEINQTYSSTSSTGPKARDQYVSEAKRSGRYERSEYPCPVKE